MSERGRFPNEAPDSPSREYGVYVSDIARGVTNEQLKDAFSSIGRVYDALIVKNKFTGETKGYGFVRFHNMDDVYAALDCKELPRFEDSVSHKLYVFLFLFTHNTKKMSLGKRERDKWCV